MGGLITIRNSMNARIHVDREELISIVQLAQDEYGIVATPRNAGAEPRKMDVAKNVTIDRGGVLIDGRRLPYYLGTGPFQVEIHEPPGVSVVTISLLTETVSVTPDVEARADGEVILIEEGP